VKRLFDGIYEEDLFHYILDIFLFLLIISLQIIPCILEAVIFDHGLLWLILVIAPGNQELRDVIPFIGFEYLIQHIVKKYFKGPKVFDRNSVQILASIQFLVVMWLTLGVSYSAFALFLYRRIFQWIEWTSVNYSATLIFYRGKKINVRGMLTMGNRAFDEGAMREAFYVKFSQQFLSIEYIKEHFQKSDGIFVAKRYKNKESRNLDLHITDSNEQEKIREWAEKFNKAVSLIGACKLIKVLEVGVFSVEINGKQELFNIEPFIQGKYEKWSNNWNWVNSSNNTPHSFTHWVFQNVGWNNAIPVDLQGVYQNGVYWLTDPQVHSYFRWWQLKKLLTGEKGVGNAEKEGIEIWKQNHQCSQLCQQLKLTPVNTKPTLQPSTDNAITVILPNSKIKKS